MIHIFNKNRLWLSTYAWKGVEKGDNLLWKALVCNLISIYYKWEKYEQFYDVIIGLIYQNWFKTLNILCIRPILF